MNVWRALKQPGIVGRRGDRRTVLCDFDRLRPPRLRTVSAVLARIGILRHAAGLLYERSTSGGWHLTIRFNREFTSGELVAIQMALGSDRWREQHNLRRVISGAAPAKWNLLFNFKL